MTTTASQTNAASIAAAELRSQLSQDDPPIVIDVRKAAAFRESTGMISGALRRDPQGVNADTLAEASYGRTSAHGYPRS